MTKQKNSAARYKYEYLKHLQKNAFPIVLYLIAFMLVSIGLIIVTLLINSPLSNNNNSIKTCKYNYAIESQEKQSVFRQNYKLENLVTFHKSDKRINVNTYLNSDFDNGIIRVNGNLESDEVIISRQIANRLNVCEGDQIQIDLPIYDTPSDYYVKAIIPYISDYYKISDNLDFSVAFLGYDDKIVSQTNGKYIIFLDNTEYEEFKQSDIIYIKKYDVHNELSEIYSKSVLYISLSLLLSFIIICVYNLEINKAINKEIDKYSKDCFSIKIIKFYYSIDYILYSAIPLLTLCIVSLLLKVSIFYTIGYACITGFWTLWCLIGGKRFEKAT